MGLSPLLTTPSAIWTNVGGGNIMSKSITSEKKKVVISMSMVGTGTLNSPAIHVVLYMCHDDDGDVTSTHNSLIIT